MRKTDQLRGIRQLMLLTLLLFSASVSVKAAMPADTPVSINFKSEQVTTVLKEVQKQSGLNFFYSTEVSKEWPRITIRTTKKPASEVVAQIASMIGCEYTIKGNIVTISKQKASGRERTVKGIVRDSDGEPLVGVPVCIGESRVCTVTDADGFYTFKIPVEKTVLKFSYVGMENIYITIPQGNSDVNRDIAMRSDSQLDEVVVTGYQTISKERATGSYSIIKKEDIQKRHSSSLSQALEGLVAGMQGNNDGRGGKTFTIRGTSTMNADTQPLIVIDGFPIMDNPSSGGSMNPNMNALERINTDDIESITFLKDAAAASIWGARSANGVIVITTKKAQKDKKRWNVDASTQLSLAKKQDVAHITNLATSAQMINYQRWMFENDMMSGGYTQNISNLYNSMTQSELLLYQGMSWGTLSTEEMDRQLAALAALDNRKQIEDNLLKNPLQSQTNVAVSGSIGDWSTRISTEFVHQQGEMIGRRDNTWKLDWQNDYRINKHVALNLGVNLVNANRHSSLITLQNISELSPYEMLLNADGSYSSNFHNSYNSDVLSMFDWSGFTYKNMNYNLLQEARSRQQRTTNTQLRTQAGLQIDIFNGLRFNSRFQYEMSRYKQRDTNAEESFYTRYQVNYYTPGDLMGNALGQSAVPTGNIVINREGKNHSTLFRNDITFDKVVGEKHAINAVIGNEISNYYYESWTNPYLYGVKNGNPGIQGQAGYVDTMNGSQSSITGVPTEGKVHIYESWNHNRFVSFYGNASYMYDERYGFSISARSDASNLITSDPKYRWSPLWSVGAMWNIANESWLKESNVVNRLTLRLTYGQNGNTATSSSARTTINTQSSYPDEWTGVYPGSIYDYGNPTLRWEKTAITNAGLDFSLLGNHIFGSLDYYYKKSTDVLGQVAIAAVNGTSYATFNNAEMLNKGVEVTLGAQGSIGDLTLGGTLTYAYNKNEITKLYTEANNLSDFLNSYYIPGYPMSPMFAFTYGGMRNGIPTMAGTDGQNYDINDFNIYYMPWEQLLHYEGTTIAPHTAGLNLSLGWKTLTLSAYLNGRFGHKMIMPQFSYNYISSWGNKTNINAQVADLMDANGHVISGPKGKLPLPTVDDEGNPIGVMYYNAWSMYRRSLDINTDDASYIYLSEIDLNYQLPRKWLGRHWVKDISIFGKLENVGLIWTANSQGYHPEYLPGSYRPELTFSIGANIKF